MIDAGLEEEARRLLARYGDLGPQASQALGYKEMADCAAGRCPFDETVRLIKRNTRRFARRQLQWFAKFDSVEWIDMAALERSAASADQLSEMAAERILESVGGD